MKKATNCKRIARTFLSGNILKKTNTMDMLRRKFPPKRRYLNLKVDFLISLFLYKKLKSSKKDAASIMFSAIYVNEVLKEKATAGIYRKELIKIRCFNGLTPKGSFIHLERSGKNP